MVSGTFLHSTVTATNAAGLISQPVHSNGFVWDQSPPISLQFFDFADNLLLNSNFDSGVDNWLVSAELVNLEINHALCILNGNFHQIVSTEPYGQYRLRFHAFNGGDDSTSASLGYIHFGDLEKHTFSAVTLNDDIHTRQKVYFLLAQGTRTTLEFGTLGTELLCMSQIELEPMSEGPRKPQPIGHPEANFAGSIHVHVIAADTGSTVLVKWDFVDVKSPILDYMLAIGTVQGQLTS